MLLSSSELPWLAQLGLVVLLLVIAVKIYLAATLGVCKNSERLDGKTVIITGANTGIGKETALDLAKRGARVILACRDLKKATVARDEIILKSGNKDVVVGELNLASLKSVRKFSADVLKSEPRLDILINNAGCAGLDKKITEDGLEYQMQSNHFGHFLLTNLLLGKNITVNTLHPGAVMTDFLRWIPPFWYGILEFFGRIFCKTTEQGAQTTIYLAVADEVANITGEYFADCKVKNPSKLARDAGLAKKLWEISETLVGLKPEEKQF